MATDVEIVIGAKDQASKILQQVQNATKATGNDVKKMATKTNQASRTISNAFSAIQSSFAPLLAIFAAVKTATAGFQFVSNAAEAFDTQEEAVRGLTSALKIHNSDGIGPSIEMHQSFAAALQNSINVGDEVTLGLMKQATMLGVSNDQLQEVTRAAIGMAEATGASLEDSLRKVNETINGNSEAFAEFLPQLRNASTEQEKLAIVLKTAEAGLQQQADRSNTAQGSAQRLANTWGDFREVVGQALAPVRMMINNGLNVLVQVIQSAVIPALQAITPSVETVQQIMQRFAVHLVSVVTTAEVIIGNLPTIWEIVSTKVRLYVTGIVEDIRHGFTQVIPAYLQWFGENAFTMISDAFNAAVVSVINSTRQIADIISRMWEFVRSGFQGGPEALFADIGQIAARNLLDGFQAKTKELPKIMGRSITDGEQAMLAKVNGATENLSDQFKKKLADRLKALGKSSGKELLAGLSLSLGASESENVLDKIAKGSKGNSELSGKVSRLLTRGQASQDPAKQAVELLKKIANKAENIDNNTKPDQSLSKDTVIVGAIG